MVLTRDWLNKFLCRWWIPVGFALFLTGLFWSPNSHIYKVAIPYCLLLPALLSAFLNQKAWLFALRFPVVWLTLLYLAYMVSVTIALNGDKGFEFSKWSFYIVLFLFGVGVRMSISERTLALILLGGAFVASTAGIYALHRDISNGLFWHPPYRLKGYASLYNALRTGFLMGAFSLFAFWCALNAKLSRWQCFLSALIALICLAITVLTGSRAPLLALTVVGLWVGITQKRWLYAAAVIAISSIVLTVFWDRLSERGISFRPEIWRYVWQQCLAHPWFGVGLDRDPIEVLTSGGIMYNTHNIFLAVFYQGGIFGLLLFIAMISTTFYQSWTIRQYSAFGTLAALLQLYAIVSLQFDGVALCTRPADNWMLLWLPVALHIYAQRAATKKLTAPPESRQCAVL
jgi:O-antigen ligase